MKIGLLVIATNKYIEFVGPLWESAKKFFLKNHDVSMFVFTNQPEVPEGTTRVEHQHTPWPGPTLLRYHCFSKNKAVLKDMDYLYYCDADMRFEQDVGEEVLGDLVATKHPGFWDKPEEFIYQSRERRRESMAYMAPGDGNGLYFAGGFNGGKRDKFLSMCDELSFCVDQDKAKGIVAVWHDESHLNRYLSVHKPTVILSPAYCYQEELSMPLPRKLVALKKNHAEWRT